MERNVDVALVAMKYLEWTNEENKAYMVKQKNRYQNIQELWD